MEDEQLYTVKLSALLGVSLAVERWKRTDDLPEYLVQNRKFYKVQNGDASFLIIELDEKFSKDSRILHHQMENYQYFAKMYVAYSVKNISRQSRSAYIEHGISFICLPDQVYLPFLGMLLTNRFNREKIVSNDKMTPTAQQLFLLLLYSDGDPVSKSKAALMMKKSAASITSASAILVKFGLVVQKRNGKELLLYRTKSGVELLNMARPYLINPVKTVITVYKIREYLKIPFAGETALGKYGMLNEPAIECRAIYGKTIDAGVSFNEEEWEKEDKLLHIQQWKYDCNLFSHNDLVDPVSLACSFMGNKDERIEIELEKMIKEYQWQ